MLSVFKLHQDAQLLPTENTWLPISQQIIPQQRLSQQTRKYKWNGIEYAADQQQIPAMQ